MASVKQTRSSEAFQVKRELRLDLIGLLLAALVAITLIFDLGHGFCCRMGREASRKQD